MIRTNRNIKGITIGSQDCQRQPGRMSFYRYVPYDEEDFIAIDGIIGVRFETLLIQGISDFSARQDSLETENDLHFLEQMRSRRITCSALTFDEDRSARKWTEQQLVHMLNILKPKRMENFVMGPNCFKALFHSNQLVSKTNQDLKTGRGNREIRTPSHFPGLETLRFLKLPPYPKKELMAKSRVSPR